MSYTDAELRGIAGQPCYCTEEDGQCDPCCAAVMLAEREKLAAIRDEVTVLPEDPDVAF